MEVLGGSMEVSIEFRGGSWKSPRSVKLRGGLCGGPWSSVEVLDVRGGSMEVSMEVGGALHRGP